MDRLSNPLVRGHQSIQANSAISAACKCAPKGRSALQPIYPFVTISEGEQGEDHPMDNSGIREITPPTADIKSLHQELQQLFAGTQNRNSEATKEGNGTSAGTCLVIKGK